ncbi:MAG: dihydrofolate reductase family protein [Chloroflexia bacterium]
MKIIMLAALTIDGKLARNSAHFVDWTSREDKRIFSSTTRQAGALILGHNTYKTFPTPLPGRLHVVMTYSLAGKESVPGEVEYTSDPPERIVASLEARGYTEAVVGGGSQVNSLFLQANLVDEIWLTIEPAIFGLGVDLLHGIQFDLQAKLIHLERLNDAGAIHLRYSLR